MLSYTRNKYASTIDLEDGALVVQATLEDTFFSSVVEMVVKVPDLQIASINGKIKRAFNDKCRKAIPLLQKVVGLHIGPGTFKTVNALIGGSTGCPRMANLVLECCDQVVYRFTASMVRDIQSRSSQEQIEATREFIKQNPHFIGSCIAYSEGSPLLKELGT